MISRTIVAALLAGLASPVLAEPAFPGQAYEQAAGMSRGKGADATFDGNTARTAVQDPVTGTPINGVSAAPAAASSKPSLAADVPPPEKPAAKTSFMKKMASKRGLILGLAGAGVGFIMGGPLGAVIGALAGLAIGFVLSKLMHRKH